MVPVYERTRFYCFLHEDNGLCTGPLPATYPPFSTLIYSPSFFGRPDHQLCLPSPELGTHRDTHWIHTVQSPYWRGFLTPAKAVGDEEGGTSGAFLACRREQLVEMPRGGAEDRETGRPCLGREGSLESIPSGEYGGNVIGRAQHPQRPEKKGIGLGPEVPMMAGVRVKRPPAGYPQRGKAMAKAPDASRAGVREQCPSSFSVIEQTQEWRASTMWCNAEESQPFGVQSKVEEWVASHGP